MCFALIGCVDIKTTTILDNLESFYPIAYPFDTYLVFNGKNYFDVPNLDKENLIINQIDDTGILVHKYIINDKRVSKVIGFQKGTNDSFLLMRNPIIPRELVVYNLTNNRFSVLDFPEKWNPNTGINTNFHISNDIWITTLTSHISGLQRDENTPDSGMLDSTCNLNTGLCFENDKETYDGDFPIVEFDNGNVLVIRKKQIDINETKLQLFLNLFLYNNDGVLLQQKCIEDEDIHESILMYHNNSVWLIPFYLKKDNTEYLAYIISDSLELESVDIRNSNTDLYEACIFNYLFSENQTICSTGNSIQLFTIENNTVFFTRYEYLFSDDVYLSIKTINFERGEIYAIAWSENNYTIEIFDFDFERIKTIPLNQSYTDSSGFIIKVN